MSHRPTMLFTLSHSGVDSQFYRCSRPASRMCQSADMWPTALALVSSTGSTVTNGSNLSSPSDVFTRHAALSHSRNILLGPSNHKLIRPFCPSNRLFLISSFATPSWVRCKRMTLSASCAAFVMPKTLASWIGSPSSLRGCTTSVTCTLSLVHMLRRLLTASSMNRKRSACHGCLPKPLAPGP